jgi:hypothetical protein
VLEHAFDMSEHCACQYMRYTATCTTSRPPHIELVPWRCELTCERNILMLLDRVCETRCIPSSRGVYASGAFMIGASAVCLPFQVCSPSLHTVFHGRTGQASRLVWVFRLDKGTPGCTYYRTQALEKSQKTKDHKKIIDHLKTKHLKGSQQ